MLTLPTWSPCVLLDALATESRFLEALEGDFVGIASRVVDIHQTVRGADALAPSAVGLSQRVISCASLSKCPGAPGLRLGWPSRPPRRSRNKLSWASSTPWSQSPLDQGWSRPNAPPKERRRSSG